MGCNSDYMRPDGMEESLQKTAKLLKYCLTKLKKAVPKGVSDAAENIYCKDDYVPKLCKLLSNLPEKTFDSLVYDAKNKTSRQLADWWEEHVIADRERVKEEKENLKRSKKDAENKERAMLAKLKAKYETPKKKHNGRSTTRG